jgi:hypothetical protein
VEPGRRGAVFKVHPPPVNFLGSSNGRLTQGRAGQGSLAKRSLTTFRYPDQPKPRLAQRVCRVGLGRLVLLVSGNGLGTNATGMKSHASPFHHAPFGNGRFLVRSLRRGVLV